MASKRKNGSLASGSSTPANKRARGTTPEDDEYTVDANVESDSDDDNIRRAVERWAPKKHVARSQADAASHLFTKSDQFGAHLKPDHDQRPLWVDPDGRIILESFSEMFKEAQTFLINIAEPQSRVSRMHEYNLTTHSLFAAVSVGLTTEDIIRDLDMFSKVPLDPDLISFIRRSTESFGKARLVLKNTKYFIESSDPAVLQRLLQDPIIRKCRIDSEAGIQKQAAPTMGNLAIPGTKLAAGANQAVQPADKDIMATLREDDDDDDEGVDEVHAFQIAGEDRQQVSKQCREIDLPLTEEYDFRNDEANANLEIDLKPSSQIRPYQEQALNKMFGNGRARSGIIVLPCGAGKTLVGITAACTVKKGVIVLCTSAMSVVQWRAEFLKWSNINPNDIAVFTADNKDKFHGNTGILISTYSMITQTKGRSHDSKKIMDFITEREWGLMLLDEVHVVPADMFKRVTYGVATHSKLGLTATLLREDEKIDDLNFLIGPKLYEANWQELSEQGHIAKVQCAEVWCPMTTEFYTEYLKANTVNRRALLFTMNPRKFQACQFLIDYHEKRGDKVIVFSDNVYALEKYARKLGKAYIYGGTPQQERLRILENFQHNELVNTVFLSKIGDTSLDLPEATCLIQISSHYGSRRQEAQRLGRILRAKRRNDEGFNAFFYSLVSKDTQEMYYSSKRQAFLVDQGYAFKVITHLQGIENLQGLSFNIPQERRELLQEVLLQNESQAEAEQIEGDLFSNNSSRKGKKSGVRRQAGMLSELAGGKDMAYVEYNASRNKQLKKKTATSNKFIKSLKRDQQKLRQAKKDMQD
ncbi:component of the holoenzyme form of RNA polymerase transcription factor [Pseudovirgaria hyperparasitica]|uniref:DNA 3'-5' helicase n=1 Tax=Pseudovirgaria hyperparasitica TaxID=470096 RepID=A0A6A6VVY7_9PEZI|nr:component of the holoenzyme form of RNA polymerase transcription factor [Pseudovirgaria hyperparasitica]KAF2754848.1 component of the holoenzyme form of RNA polymerase transcription factor [Pseudovirgaria hyperparasitica]